MRWKGGTVFSTIGVFVSGIFLQHQQYSCVMASYNRAWTEILHTHQTDKQNLKVAYLNIYLNTWNLISWRFMFYRKCPIFVSIFDTIHQCSVYAWPYQVFGQLYQNTDLFWAFFTFSCIKSQNINKMTNCPFRHWTITAVAVLKCYVTTLSSLYKRECSLVCIKTHKSCITFLYPPHWTH